MIEANNLTKFQTGFLIAHKYKNSSLIEPILAHDHQRIIENDVVGVWLSGLDLEKW